MGNIRYYRPEDLCFAIRDCDLQVAKAYIQRRLESEMVSLAKIPDSDTDVAVIATALAERVAAMLPAIDSMIASLALRRQGYSTRARRWARMYKRGDVVDVERKVVAGAARIERRRHRAARKRRRGWA